LKKVSRNHYLFHRQDAKFAKEVQDQTFDFKDFQTFFVVLVPIHHKNEYGNRYYTDLFKFFIEGRHGELGVLAVK
jgi:hypothetical protein